MDTVNNNFTTPKQTKRLGLRRGSSINSLKKKTVDITENILNKNLPQSDVKISYKQLEQNDYSKSTVNNATTPDTPKNLSPTELHRLAVSTNCRPYRLALSKRMREKMTKKRLEFYLANEMEKEESEATHSEGKLSKEDVTEETFASEDLLHQIEVARKELIARQEHLNKVQELQQAIAVWKTGFRLAFHDLQQKIEPRLETEVLLEQLHIPQEMIKYINE